MLGDGVGNKNWLDVAMIVMIFEIVSREQISVLILDKTLPSKSVVRILYGQPVFKEYLIVFSTFSSDMITVEYR